MQLNPRRHHYSTGRLRIVIAQIPEQEDLGEIERIMRIRRDADLIVFPEGTLTVTDLHCVKALKDLTEKYKTAVVMGIIHEDNLRFFDYSYYISPTIVDRYQKIHVHWTEAHEPGNEFKVIDTGRCRIGLLTCYDAAFEEASRVLTLMGAEVIVIISAIPIEFPSRFALLRARAIAYNNQLYLVHCCRPGRKFSGHSAIVDPHGDMVLELGKYTAVGSKSVNLDTVRIWREREKTFEYRRPDLYRTISSLDSPV